MPQAFRKRYPDLLSEGRVFWHTSENPGRETWSLMLTTNIGSHPARLTTPHQFESHPHRPDYAAEASLVDQLIDHCGGHPRDLLRLLNYAFLAAEDEVFDQAAVEDAIKQLASEYRRCLTTDDYAFLYRIDQAPADETSQSDQAQRLLYHLALLEYNRYWWQSHPIIRTLPGYQRVAQAATDVST